MIWMDYVVESFHDGSFHVKGDWPGEVMGLKEDGSPKDHWLYKPGDVFIVDEHGVLRKQEDLTALILNYQSQKTTKT